VKISKGSTSAIRRRQCQGAKAFKLIAQNTNQRKKSYSDMTSVERSKTILYLQEQRAKLLSKLDEMTVSQDKMVAAQVTTSNNLAEVSGKLSEANNQIATLLNIIREKDKLIVALQEQINNG
jgi:hypothetical protein